MNYKKMFGKMNRKEQEEFIENLKSNDKEYNQSFYNQDFKCFDDFIFAAFNMATSKEGLAYWRGVILKYKGKE